MKSSYQSFLKYCLGSLSQVPDDIDDINWHELYNFAQKQSIIGVFIEKILNQDNVIKPDEWKGNKPTDDDVMEWMANIRALENNYKLATKISSSITTKFKKEGFYACILKGIGNARLYPTPSLRTSGDIDVWVIPQDKYEVLCDTPNPSDDWLWRLQSQSVEQVIAYCRKYITRSKACYHHIDFIKQKGISTEVHYRPSWLNSPKKNYYLQVWFMQHAKDCFENSTQIKVNDEVFKMNLPTWEFNVVYQLTHINSHIGNEGIGLKHLIDYFYLLKNCPQQTKNKTEYMELFKRIGLFPIAGAVMWLMKDVLGLDEKYLLCDPDAKRGKLILKEILAGGNFGFYDTRMLSGAASTPIKKNVQRIIRDFRLIRYFPNESMWEPWFRLYHYFWRIKHR